MRASLDAKGRLLIPKAMRDALGLRVGQVLEVTVHDGQLEIGRASGGSSEIRTARLAHKLVRKTLERLRR